MKLSVIIPVCNVEQYIGPCLESIYRQGLSDKDFEVIVVNDGSTDNSMQVVEDIRLHHHNIQMVWRWLGVNMCCSWIPTTC